MNIRMLTIMCGPDGNHHPGDVLEVSAEQGKAMIAARAAAEIDDGASTPAAAVVDKSIDVETADMTAEETQTEIKPRRGPRKPRNSRA